MPTYEYRCKDCGHTFDAYQSFTDDALTECPECQGALKKVFGNVGISFKGSGFYKTDSRAGANGKAKSKVDAGSGDPSSTSDKGSSEGSSSSSGTDKGSTKEAKGSGAKDSGTKAGSSTGSGSGGSSSGGSSS